MKRVLLILCVILSCVPCYAGTVIDGVNTTGSSGSGVITASDCSTYVAIGQICQDTGDGKLYKGTGAAVEEIATGTTVATDAIFDAAGDLVQGSGANTSEKLTKGAEGTILRAGAASNAYSTSTFADTYAKGTFLYNASANTVASLAHPGAANYLLSTNAADTAAWLLATDLVAIEALTCTENQIMKKNGAGAWACAADADTGSAFAVTDITSQTDDTTPATTATLPLAQGGSLIESTVQQIVNAGLAAPAAIGSGTPAAGTFTTLGAGAAGFAVDADGDVTAKSVTVSKVSGSAGDMAVYEANSTDTHAAGFRGPASITGDGAYRIKFPDARASSANMVLAVTNGSESGTGTAADPYIQTGSWADLDDKAPVANPIFTGVVDIPVGATTDAEGEITIDVTSDQFRFYGSAQKVIPSVQFVSFVIPAPAEADDINIMKAPYGMTITGISCIVQGTTSVTGQIQECSATGTDCADLDTGSDITCDADGAADDGTLTDSAIASGAWLRWKTTSLSGTPTFLTVTVKYNVVAD